MNFLHKLQNLPEQKRKIILWIAVIVVGILFFTFYIKNVQQRLKSFKAEELQQGLKIPELQEELKELPKFEMPKLEIPEISEEELKKLEEILKEAPQ